MNKINNIESLILQTRDSKSQMHIKEAFSAYNGSAYRASIVSTWIAVVFDLIAKIRELSESGDKQAIKHIKELEKIIALNRSDTTKITKLQKFENSILTIALNEFEIINDSEFELLARIKADRNLCAHPAFVDNSELFDPTPELVRSHIVHALIHLLIIKPIQGKVAFAQVINDLKSNSFPKDFESAKKYLNSKYFKNSKVSLIKNLTTGILTGLLKGEIEKQDQKLNISHTLKVISEEFPKEYDIVLKGKLNNILNGTKDGNLWDVLMFVAKNPTTWSYFELHNQLKLIESLKAIKVDNVNLENNFSELKDVEIPALKEILQDKIETLREIALAGIDKFGDSRSYKSALTNGKKYILPNIKYFDEEHVKYLIQKILENRSDQIIHASGMEMIIESVYAGTYENLNESKEEWQSLKLKLIDEEERYRSLIRRIENDI